MHAVAVAVLPAFLFGIIALGQYAREQIQTQPRYKVFFSEIDCTVPPGMSRSDFLGEVQYTAELPDHFNALDPQLPRRLADAFAQHPWVEKVLRVTVDHTKQVHVALLHRTPVLAVRWQGVLRAVDRDGVLLPANAATQGLPVYSGKVSPPAGAGSRWGDADIEAAARQAWLTGQ
jgi:hypothetical protein